MAESGEEAKAQALSVDMDAMIDEILAKKGPQKYHDGLSEDNWEQEMERIPLFMTKSPDSIDPDKDTALTALQQLKYETSTPEGRAMAHKEEGNEHFKKKKYKLAVEEYGAGIKEKCSDVCLNAVLYCNRAAAQFHLGNYRSSITDATQAKKLKQDHIKAYVRGALACQKLQRYGEVIEWCDEGLWVDAENANLKELRVKATKEKKKQERDKRRQAAAEKSKLCEEQKLVEVIKSRGIQLAVDDVSDSEGLPRLSLQGPHPSGGRVHIDGQGHLIWPVLLLYPEYGQTDFIAAFNENQRFSEHIAVMFGEEPPPWDRGRHYTPSTIEIYYENQSSGGLTRVELQSSLAEVLSSPGYLVMEGTPSFIVLATRTCFRDQYLVRNSSS